MPTEMNVSVGDVVITKKNRAFEVEESYGNLTIGRDPFMKGNVVWPIWPEDIVGVAHRKRSENEAIPMLVRCIRQRDFEFPDETWKMDRMRKLLLREMQREYDGPRQGGYIRYDDGDNDPDLWLRVHAVGESALTVYEERPSGEGKEWVIPIWPEEVTAVKPRGGT